MNKKNEEVLFKEIKSIINEFNSTKTRKLIARGFVKRGLNKTIAYKILNNISLLENSTDIELLTIIDTLNILSEKKIDVSKYFDENVISEFKNMKLLDEYFPSNFNIDDDYEYLKLYFINESYMNENTKRTFWHLYKTLIHRYELKNKKDLCKFSLAETEELVRDNNTAITTKRNLLSFIQRYNEWCVLENIVEENNLENVELQTMLTIPKSNTKINYVSFEELYKNGLWLENKNDNDIILLDVLIALLMRSGLKTLDIVEMRYSDVNYDTGEVEFESNGVLIKRHLKKFVVKILKEVEKEVVLVGASKRPLLKVDDHVVKTLDPEYNKEKMYKNIRKRMSKFKRCYRTLNENILINSLKFDDLDLIENKNGEVTIKDYKNIQEKYGNNANSYQKLREDYQMYKQQLKQ